MSNEEPGAESETGFANPPDNVASAFIQWKGTDVCLDFHCDCGADGHFDGFFAYSLQCAQCGSVWEMPRFLLPRKADSRTYDYWRENPRSLEMRDE